MSEDDGVMGAPYARERGRSTVLSYRLRARALAAYQAAEKYIPFKGYYRVLDLGCAEGRTLLCLREHFGGRGEFVGIEASRELVDLHPQLPADTTLICGDALNPPELVAENSFDLVTALAVLEHLPDPVALGDVARRMLKKGGLFVASCPHPGWDRMASRLGGSNDDAHLTEMGPSEMMAVAARVGAPHFEPFMLASVGALPYVGLPVPATWSARADKMTRALLPPVGRHLFVNQLVCAQKTTD